MTMFNTNVRFGFANATPMTDADLRRAAEEDETARQLQTMPGIGPITASVLVATLPDVSVFRSARDLSAWLEIGRASCRERVSSPV